MLDLAGVTPARGRARRERADRARRGPGRGGPVAAGAVLRRLLRRRGRGPGGRAGRGARRADARRAPRRPRPRPRGLAAAARRRRGRGGRPARRQVFTGFSRTMPVTRPVVPLLEAVHDRAVVELMRGCTAGCRFCQAGMWYRPVRERPVDLVVEAAERALAATGCDEVSLVSLSSCDYSAIDEARDAGPRPAPGPARLAALVAHRLGGRAARALRRRRSGGRSPWPRRPATQALRDRINKGIDEVAGRGGRRGGLQRWVHRPEAVLHDRPARRDRRGRDGDRRHGGARRRSSRSASAAAAPACRSPCRRTSPSRTRRSSTSRSPARSALRRRQGLVRDALPRGVKASFHDVGASLVEATLARGGRGSDVLVERAWRAGARFDGWTRALRPRAWRAAAEACDVVLGEPAMSRLAASAVARRGRPGRRRGVPRRRAARGPSTGCLTEDCRGGRCGACGVCGDGVEMEIVA